MQIAIFCHSLLSDWNHGNAHFLRGIGTDLVSRGHRVDFYEPQDSWSLRNLLSTHGIHVLENFRRVYPTLQSHRYDAATLDLDRELDGVDLVLVHEWNDPGVIRRLGEHRSHARNYRLLFHDTHHRAASKWSREYDIGLRHYDGVLAFGRSLRDLYIKNGWTGHAWTWHEAADTRVFHPIADERDEDVVWIGNWGDEERSSAIAEYLIGPVKALGLNASIYGVRYPDSALAQIEVAGIRYRGWTPNFEVPGIFSRFKATVHIPRRYYAEALPGIPTIRVFEALACGIPLVSAPWEDSERLFDEGKDFLMARDAVDMQQKLRMVLNDNDLADELRANGLRTVLDRHTCAKRVDELLAIYRVLRSSRYISASEGESGVGKAN